MGFLLFHGKFDDEIRLRMDAIIGFRTYTDGSRAVLMMGETENPIFVKEDYDYLVKAFRDLEEAQTRAFIGSNVVRKFNGQG